MVTQHVKNEKGFGADGGKRNMLTMQNIGSTVVDIKLVYTSMVQAQLETERCMIR